MAKMPISVHFVMIDTIDLTCTYINKLQFLKTSNFPVNIIFVKSIFLLPDIE